MISKVAVPNPSCKASGPLASFTSRYRLTDKVLPEDIILSNNLSTVPIVKNTAAVSPTILPILKIIAVIIPIIAAGIIILKVW